MPGVYFGEDRHSIDPKGRLNIPARHRRTSAEHGSHKLWVMPGEEGCLVVLDAEGFAACSRRVDSSQTSTPELRRAERKLFSKTHELEPDAQGRVVIPERLRVYAGLDREVVIVGANGRLELWSPERFAAEQEATDQEENRRPEPETVKSPDR